VVLSREKEERKEHHSFMGMNEQRPFPQSRTKIGRKKKGRTERKKAD
jgi:hypothetical protein